MKEKTSTVSKRSILLWAARDQFTQFGSSGARIDTILEAAQVNKRHLYELFLTKDGLYMAVLSEVSREIEAAFAAESGFWPREIGALRFVYRSLVRTSRVHLIATLGRSLSDAQRSAHSRGHDGAMGKVRSACLQRLGRRSKRRKVQNCRSSGSIMERIICRFFDDYFDKTRKRRRKFGRSAKTRQSIGYAKSRLCANRSRDTTVF